MSDDFHLFLRRRRQQLGLTLADVSYSSGLSVEEVVEIEAGCREANLQDLCCLAVPLRTSMFALLEQQVESEWKKLGPEWQAWRQEMEAQIWPVPGREIPIRNSPRRTSGYGNTGSSGARCATCSFTAVWRC